MDEDNASFGYWVQRRRKALDLTQADLARRVGCSTGLIRMIEADTRRPSRQIAELLAEQFAIPPDERGAFVKAARGELAVHRLAAPTTAAGSPLPHPPAHPPHNLPIQLTSFVGREKEIAEIKRLLSPLPRAEEAGEASGVRARLLTLTGSGGCGKTRLALQVASTLLESFPDGVWLIELAPLADPTLIPQTVAAVFGPKEEAGRPLLDTLTHHLRHKKALLVLDNCEHLVQASAQFAEALLHACPDLHILATSREGLGVAGERSFYVPSLLTPDPHTSLPVEEMMRYDAVRLFVERAVAVLPSFAVTDDNATAVAQVCRRLNGIPLAIELAASRAKMLRVEQIAARLDDRFQLLTSGSRTAVPRHQTLLASIEWSYDLLSAPERILLRRLSVFAGGWTLEAAEAVGAEVVGADPRVGPEADAQVGSGIGQGADTQVSPYAVLDLLTQLVNKSLVAAERKQGAETRYRMLETIREYALGRLEASGEGKTVRRQHAEYYTTLAEAGVPSNPGQYPQPAWFHRMYKESDNLRAALAWSLSAIDGAELGLRLAGATAWIWYWNEASGWLESALAHPEGAGYTHARAVALLSLGDFLAMEGGNYAAGQEHMAHSLRLFQELGDLRWSAYALDRLGWLAREHGDFATARLRLEESLALCREIEDQPGVARALVTLGEVVVMQEDAAWATALIEEALAMFRQLGDTQGISWALNHLGHVAQLRGEYERARRLHEESLVRFREIGPQNVGIAQTRQALGETALAQGDTTLATTHLTEALIMFQDLGDRMGLAWCLASLAGVAAVNEEPERAAWLWGTAEALRQSIGAREAPASRAARERLIAQARSQLGEAAFAAAWEKGRKLKMEEAVAEALGHQAAREP